MIPNVTIWELGETIVLGKKALFVNFDCHNGTAIVDLSADSEDHNLHPLKRSYHRHRSSKDVKKLLPVLEGK